LKQVFKEVGALFICKKGGGAKIEGSDHFYVRMVVVKNTLAEKNCFICDEKKPSDRKGKKERYK
jgi:hypothetical protein